MSGKIFELAKPANVSLWKELSKHFARPKVKAQLAKEMDGVTEPERRTFLMANLVCEQLAFRFFEKFVQQIRTRQRDRKHAGAERDRADPASALALHLRVSTARRPSRPLAAAKSSCR